MGSKYKQNCVCVHTHTCNRCGKSKQAQQTEVMVHQSRVLKAELDERISTYKGCMALSVSEPEEHEEHIQGVEGKPAVGNQSLSKVRSTSVGGQRDGNPAIEIKAQMG